MKRTSRRTKAGGAIDGVIKDIRIFLSRNPVLSFKKRQLAKLLGYTSEHEYARLKQALRHLQEAGEIVQIGRRKFGRPGQSDTEAKKPEPVVARVSDSSNDLKRNVVRAKPGSPGGKGQRRRPDISKVKKSTEGKENRRRLEHPEPVSQGEKRIVGTVERIGSSYKLITRDRSMPPSIDVSRKKLNGASEGQKVVASVTLDRFRNYIGEILNVLGDAGDPEVELRSVAAQFDLRQDFPEGVLAETQKISDRISEKEIAGRLDLRDRRIFTIDPQDAKDFDDAVSLKTIDEDLYELGVHIADVSSYVREGSKLDDEAYKRGTSVYLTSGVIPMLPHRLSNELCSLNPDVDRLTYSVIMKVRSTGKIEDYRFAKSIIRSKRRFTYEEVQKIIETGKGDFAQDILSMDSLAKILNRIRSRAGSIDFDLPEAKFVYDELGRPIEIVKKIRLDSHRLVEEFMLLANKIVATHIGRHGVKAKPFLYRVHDVPDPEKIRELAAFVSHFGYSMNYDGTVGQKQLQRLLKATEGKPEEYLINDIVLRSMAKAIYSEENIGHYGLAFKYYTHFTSPIRRYPDLVVHRLLYKYETSKEMFDTGPIKRMVKEVGSYSSEMERLAVEAERESVKIKQAQFMMDHLGDEYSGTVSGITNFGMFVEVDDLLVEGLVHVREMDDYYALIPDRLQLKGRRTGKVYQLGDRVTVKVLKVNMERHEIDFVLC